MAKKIFDLCVAVGKYTKDGKEKTRYENIGVEMENTEGDRYLLLKPWINVAGIPIKQGDQAVLVSKFSAEQKIPQPDNDNDYQ